MVRQTAVCEELSSSFRSGDRRAGFQTDRFSLGQLVTITGWPGRRDRVVYLNRAQMDDGTELLCIGARCNLTEEE